MAIVRFDAEAQLLLPLTDDWAAIGSALDRLAAAQVRPGTRIDAGLSMALDHLADRGQPGRRRVVILLTDGTQVHGRLDVLEAALRAWQAGIDIFAIGLGDLVDALLLEQIAGVPERYASASDGDELARACREIAHMLRCR